MKSFFQSVGRAIRLPINRRYAFKRLADYHREPRSLPEVVDWAMNFGGGGYMRVKTLQIPSEITALAELVASKDPEIILEIGTASAGTLLIWSHLAKRQVVTCDLRDMRHQASLYEQLPPPGSDCQVTLLSGNSHSPEFKERVSDALKGEQVDFLFIDGDHTEQGVTQDYLDYKEFVRPGGLIAFHDILENQPLKTNQVYHLWKRLTPIAETKEFVHDCNQCGFGIGVLEVGPSGAPDL